MSTVFQVEGNTASNGSGLTGVYCNKRGTSSPHDVGYPSPPSSFSSVESGDDDNDATLQPTVVVDEWMEFWDYAGGASFRAFVAQDGDERTLFAFIDAGLLNRDLKKA